MAAKDMQEEPSGMRRESFPTTHWSVVLAAGDTSDPDGREALQALCTTYWQPIYSFIRRLGHSPADAQDLTQAFLVSLMTRKSLSQLAPSKGRFRSFLLTSLRYFLADQWDKDHALKRGGGTVIFSLDADRAEACYAIEPANETDPARIFERRWALTLLQRVLTRLEAEMECNNKGALWQDLKGYLLEEDDLPTYREFAERRGMSLSAVKMTVARLRRRFGELLRAEVAATVSDEGEVEDELRHLVRVVKG